MNRTTQWVANILVLLMLVFLPTYFDGDWNNQVGVSQWKDSYVQNGYRFTGFVFPFQSSFGYLDFNTLVVEFAALGAILFWVNTASSRRSNLRRRGILAIPLALTLLTVLIPPMQSWVHVSDQKGYMIWQGYSFLFSNASSIIEPRLLFIEIAAVFLLASIATKWYDNRALRLTADSDFERLPLNEPVDSPASQSPLQYLGLASR